MTPLVDAFANERNETDPIEDAYARGLRDGIARVRASQPPTLDVERLREALTEAVALTSGPGNGTWTRSRPIEEWRRLDRLFRAALEADGRAPHVNAESGHSYCAKCAEAGPLTFIPSHCPCIAINHSHVKGECDEPASASGYAVCATCRYATTPAEGST